MNTQEVKSVSPGITEISVIMLTYNHADYLKQAIEGVLAQKTDFNIELIICNDHSPDHSDDVINELAKAYPDIIRYFKHEKNIGFVENQRFAFSKVRGNYIAYCEGDDYWTDENKLQFQFDFLEKNPEYSMVTARNLLLHQNDHKITDDGKEYMFHGKEYIDYTLDTFFRQRPTQTFTYLIRKKWLDEKWIDIYPDYRDLYYFYHLLELGRGRCYNKVIGVYRLHDGGVFSSLENEYKYLTSIGIFTNIKNVNNDGRADEQILKDMDQLINIYYYKKEFKIPVINKKLYSAIYNRFLISKNLKTCVVQLLKIVKYSIHRT